MEGVSGGISLLKILDNFGGLIPHLKKSLSLFYLLLYDQTITIKGAHSVMMIFLTMLCINLVPGRDPGH